MISELEENRRWNIFTKSRMDIYCFIYLIYMIQKQDIPFLPDITKNILNLTLSPQIKQLLLKYLAEIPQGFELSDLERYNIKRIKKYFSLFRIQNFQRHNETYSKAAMCSLAAYCLSLTEKDSLADFYGAPESFLKTILEDEKLKVSFHENPIAFTKDETIRDFLLLYNDIRLADKNQIDIRTDDIFNLSKKTKFSKIYSCIPVFQNTNREEARRLLQNVIVSEDESFKYVKNLLDHLDEKGRAIVCMSDSLFSEKSKELRKYICSSGYFTGLIRFSAGEIIPNKLSSSLLIFDKKNTFDDFIFLDLSDIELSQDYVSTIEYLKPSVIIDMFYLGKNLEEGAARKTLTYDELLKNDFDFEIKEKFDPIKFLENYQPPLILKKHAVIFRGLQDTDNIRTFETNSYLASYFYMTASDIQDGQIQYQSMTGLSQKKDSWNKYFLNNGDVIITKTAYPAFKTAIYEGPDDKVIPASNLYVIRMDNKLTGRLNPYYLKVFLESEAGLKYLKSAARGRLPAISKEALEDLPLPDKSVKEQTEIEVSYRSIQKKINEHQKEITKLFSELKKLI